MNLRLASALALVITGATRLTAQTNSVCKPSTSSNEAKLLAFFATPIAFSPGGDVSRLRPGQFRFSLEASYVPKPSEELRATDECYGIKKGENTELSPVFPRPRLAIGLPGSLVLEGSYLPPVTVADAEPNLGSVALSHLHTLHAMSGGREVDLLVRVNGTYGRVRGPITCPKKSLQQTSASLACYSTQASKDTYKPNMAGAEAALVMNDGEGRFSGYAGGGVTKLAPRFQVGFLSNGPQQQPAFLDDTKIEVDLTRAAVFAGGAWRVTRAAALTLEVYSVPTDATTARIGASYRLR
jgi:hypothetical protein